MKADYVDSTLFLGQRDEIPFSRWTRAFTHALRPFGDSYFSPLNPIFLLQIGDIATLRSRGIWLVRDGAVPLHYFFKCHPRPTGREGRLLIQSELAPLVPEVWRKRVGLYRLVSGGEAKKPQKLLLCGLGMEGYQAIGDMAAQVSASGLNEYRDSDVSAFLPLRSAGWLGDDSFAARYVTELNRHFSRPIQYLMWTQLKFKTAWRDHELVELNSGRMIADSYLAHLLLSRGAYLRVRPVSREEKFIPLSPYHGMAVRERPSSRDSAWRGPLRLEGLGTRLDLFPWESWFSGKLTTEPGRRRTGWMEGARNSRAQRN